MEREFLIKQMYKKSITNWLIVKADVTQNSATERMLQQQLWVLASCFSLF